MEFIRSKYLTTSGSVSSWGTLDLTPYLTQVSASNLYITQTSASTTYATITNLNQKPSTGKAIAMAIVFGS